MRVVVVEDEPRLLSQLVEALPDLDTIEVFLARFRCELGTGVIEIARGLGHGARNAR